MTPDGSSERGCPTEFGRVAESDRVDGKSSGRGGQLDTPTLRRKEAGWSSQRNRSMSSKDMERGRRNKPRLDKIAKNEVWKSAGRLGERFKGVRIPQGHRADHRYPPAAVRAAEGAAEVRTDTHAGIPAKRPEPYREGDCQPGGGSPVGHWAEESGTSGAYRVPCCQERQEYATREVFEQRARRSVYAVRTRHAERERLGC